MLYVFLIICVQNSMCLVFYVANVMPYRPFVAMVLCVQGSLFYVALDGQFDPLCCRSYILSILQFSMVQTKHFCVKM